MSIKENIDFYYENVKSGDSVFVEKIVYGYVLREGYGILIVDDDCSSFAKMIFEGRIYDIFIDEGFVTTEPNNMLIWKDKQSSVLKSKKLKRELIKHEKNRHLY